MSSERRRGRGITTARPTILLVYPLPARSGEDLLRSEATVVVPESDSQDALERALRDVDAIIVWGPARLGADLIEGAPRLRAIGTPGSGVDPIDVAAATRRGIPVIHTQGAAPRGVAEYAMGAMVMAHRNILGMQRRLLAGSVVWRDRLDEFAAMELTGTTLGIVGYGFIGRTLATMASAAFEMEVLTFDPFLDRADPDLGPARVVDTLEELLKASQTVSIHAPLTDSTRGLIGREELQWLGRDGVLVNAARGGVVDGPALIDALRNRVIKGAVVDVHDPEPPTPEQLAELAATPNLIVTPHVAGVTHRGNDIISMSVAEGVLTALRGERPVTVANPGIYQS